RYREFYQCDADVIGTTSLLNELELIELFDEVFNNLGLGVKVQINNRKILSGIAEILGEAERIIDITVAIDKLDKIGVDKVKAEMLSKGVSESAVNSLQPLLEFSGTHDQKLELLKKMLQSSEIGMKGIAEIEEIFGYTKALAFKKVNLEFEMTLARGLNYYTGAIFEVKVDDARSSFTSSICGGGRYDDLTGIFGLNGMSGVGISFGADRIYDVLEEAGLFPADATLSTKVLIVNFGGEDLAYSLEILRTLRNNSVYTELYPDAVKMKKQMGYADARNIPFVILAGSDERNSREVTLKNMSDGTQQKIKLDQLADLLK
ncbi:MAG TPA: ATP phosphoribosyltransferase regulatory subunit, partial [Bacteroidia bacterium]|nr:ATP phosphoribosyltransferase regulatory subunit [Bacteroidia bacterium]